MSILALVILMSILVPDSIGIIQDNQTDYVNGIIINQLLNDAQSNYVTGIIIIKNSVIQDTEVTTPATIMITSTPISRSRSGGGGYYPDITKSPTPTAPVITPAPTEIIETTPALLENSTPTATPTPEPTDIKESSGFNILLVIASFLIITIKRHL